MPRVLLYSGGLDSFIALRAGQYDIALWIDIEQKYRLRELLMFDSVSVDFEEALPNVQFVKASGPPIGRYEWEDGHIPWRNLTFLTIAAQYSAKVSTSAISIAIGALRGENSRDKSYDFLQKTSALLTWTEGREVHIHAPYKHMTKSQLVEMYLNNGFDPLHLTQYTSSCYAPWAYRKDSVGCGECQACFRRWVAMYNNGIDEEYDNPPWEQSVVGSVSWGNVRNLFATREIAGAYQNNKEAYDALNRKRRELDRG